MVPGYFLRQAISFKISGDLSRICTKGDKRTFSKPKSGVDDRVASVDGDESTREVKPVMEMREGEIVREMILEEMRKVSFQEFQS
ncbi:hypothetical protein EV1_022241 [Malus domestica]